MKVFAALFLVLLTGSAVAQGDATKNAIESQQLFGPKAGLPPGAVDPGQPSGTLSDRAGLHTPAPNTPERVALMDAFRPLIERDLGQPVIFIVDLLRVEGDWAFFRGKPRKPNGAQIDYRKTRHREAAFAGMFEDQVFALFERKGPGWRVVEWGIGNTDVPYGGFWKKFGAPKGIFDSVDP